MKRYSEMPMVSLIEAGVGSAPEEQVTFRTSLMVLASAGRTNI